MKLQFKLLKSDINEYTLIALDESTIAGSLRFTIDNNPYIDSIECLIKSMVFKKLQLTKGILIYNLIVYKSYRNQKIGTRLMNGLIEIVQLKFQGYTIFLDAKPFDDNITLENLVKFYEKFGFEYLKEFGGNAMIKTM